MSKSIERVTLDNYPQVFGWLQSKYKDIPTFEINKETLEILNELAQVNEEQNVATTMLIGDINSKIREYKSEADRISDLLETIGFNWTQLSPNVQQLARSLAASAILLEVKDTSLSR